MLLFLIQGIMLNEFAQQQYVNATSFIRRQHIKELTLDGIKCRTESTPE